MGCEMKYMQNCIFAFVFAISFIIAHPQPSYAQSPSQPSSTKAQVMVLGVFHFANPNLDTAQFKGINVLTDERQAEIEQINSDLLQFNPTRVALEIRVGQGEQGVRTRSQYLDYRAGSFQLTSNEVHQLGFRIAERMGHSEVYPVDYGVGLDIPELMAFAAQEDRDFAEWFSAYIAEATRQIDQAQETGSVGSVLRWMNSEALLAFAQAGYVRMAAVDAGESYIGARVATQWYQRNIYIFGNLARIAKPGERVLFIVGQGHAPILRQLVRDHPDMELVEPNDFLR